MVVPSFSIQPKVKVETHRIVDNIAVVVLPARFVNHFGQVKAGDVKTEEFPNNHIALGDLASTLDTNALRCESADSKQMDITVHSALAMLVYQSVPRPGMHKPTCQRVNCMASKGTRSMQ